MKLNNSVVALGAFTLLIVGTAAQDEPIKIGIVDVEQALISTEDGKAAREELTRKQREAQALLAPLQDRYRTLEDDLTAKRFVLSDDALFEKQLDLAELRNQIENKAKEIQGQLKVDQYRIQEPLLTKMRTIITDTGRDTTLIWHNGGNGIFFADFRHYIDKGVLILEMTNCNDTYRRWMMDGLHNTVLGLPPAE